MPRAAGWLAVCVGFTVLRLWLARSQTVAAIAPMPGDDELYLTLAEALLHAEWLGRLTEYTLVKGPGFPLWLPAVSASGLPFLLVQTALWATAAGVLVLALRPVVSSPGRRAMLFVAVLYNPASWADGPATRIIRDSFYSSLTILLLAAAMGLALRLRRPTSQVSWWTVITGLLGAALVLTREEGVWLSVSLVMILGWGLFAARVMGWRKLAFQAGLGLAAYFAPVATVAAVNRSHYGLFQTRETTSGYFLGAYGALTRVKPAAWRPFVPVPREVRERIYAVSPSFREIAPYLEGDAPQWTTHGCKALGVCDDVATGWFTWALLRAAALAGKYREGSDQARTWYLSVSREVDEACRDGRLDCGPPRSSFMPPWSPAYLDPLLGSLRRGVQLVATFRGLSPRSSVPLASEEDLRRYEAVTHERIPRPVARLTGVIETVVPGLLMVVTDQRRVPAAASIRRGPVPGATTSTGREASVVLVETGCVVGCFLEVGRGDRLVLAVPISSEAAGVDGDGVSWRTEGFSLGVAGIGPSRLDEIRLRIMELVTRIYGLAMPWLALIAVALTVRSAWRAVRERHLAATVAFAIALGGAVAARILLLAVIDAVAFPAVTVVYMAPAFGPYIAAVLLVLISETSPLGRLSRRAGPPPSSP